MGQSQGWTDRDWMKPIRYRRGVSEGLLPPTGHSALAPSGAGGAAREGGITSAQDRVHDNTRKIGRAGVVM